MLYNLHSARQAGRSLWKKLSRQLLYLRMRGASEEELRVAERRLRGHEQLRMLQRADIAVVSIGKSGRTWLRVMLSRVYQTMYGLPENALLGFDNFHSMNRAIPRIFFTHDNYIKDYSGHTDSKADFYDTRVVMLARDPRDVAVSQFFQWKYRMKPEKIKLLRYPERGSDISIYDFLMRPGGYLPQVIEFMNLWARESDNIRDFFLLRYEDLRADTAGTLRRLLEFMGTPASEEQIRDAVEFSSYDNMKKMEQKKVFWLSGGRMKPADRGNPDSYKVRRGKVGGYRDYFEDEQIEAIDRLVDETLSPYFGYGHREEAGAESSSGVQ